MELDAPGLLPCSCQIHVKLLVWLVVNLLQVLHVSLINCTEIFLKHT